MTDLPKLSNLFSNHIFNYTVYVTYVLFYKVHCLQLCLPRQCHFSCSLFRFKQPNDNLITLAHVFAIVHYIYDSYFVHIV